MRNLRSECKYFFPESDRHPRDSSEAPVLPAPESSEAPGCSRAIRVVSGTPSNWGARTSPPREFRSARASGYANFRLVIKPTSIAYTVCAIVDSWSSIDTSKTERSQHGPSIASLGNCRGRPKRRSREPYVRHRDPLAHLPECHRRHHRFRAFRPRSVGGSSIRL